MNIKYNLSQGVQAVTVHVLLKAVESMVFAYSDVKGTKTIFLDRQKYHIGVTYDEIMTKYHLLVYIKLDFSRGPCLMWAIIYECCYKVHFCRA